MVDFVGLCRLSNELSIDVLKILIGFEAKMLLNNGEESREGGTGGKMKKIKIGVHIVIWDQRLVLTDGF